MKLRTPTFWLLAVAVPGLLVACGSRPPAPIHDRSSNANAKSYQRKAVSSTRTKRPSNHAVRSGDTLYSIAWRYGLDHRTLGSWNGIGPPFTIYPGQKLRLSAPRKSAPSGSAGAGQPDSIAVTRSPPVTTRAKPKTTRTPTGKTATPAKKPAAAPERSNNSKLTWRWPVKGKVLKSFSASDPGAKGLNIEGKLGEAVLAAAAGEVVYSGVGLIGYGELIIIKHDQHLLSAYGHNRKRLVMEGDRVKAGQPIAELGRNGADQPMLHFEIRKDGQPVDPKRYLP